MLTGSPPPRDEIVVQYRARATVRTIEARAHAIALEQSVELPLEAVADEGVRGAVVGRVLSVEPSGGDAFDILIGLATSTTGPEAGQLLNMLFGNSSIQEDVSLIDAEFPPSILDAFGGPRSGIAGLRRLVGVGERALTCTALKPQGLSPEALAGLAGRLAEGGIDFIKDDHGIADQRYSPFDRRVALCAQAIARAGRATGKEARYFPSLSGSLDALRAQVRHARDEGLAGALIAPLIVGVPAFHALVREFPDMCFMAHPAMAGAARIAPPFLLGRLFRLFGADATIFPNHGGRFGYSPATCRALADGARAAWKGIKPTLPVAAGGMNPSRVPEMLNFYGADVMLLIGGALLSEPGREREAARAFTQAVAAREFAG